MDLLTCLLMLPAYIKLKDWQIAPLTADITLMLASHQVAPACPRCQTPAHRIHSHYERRITDRPWCEYRVCWHLTVRKCFCQNADCQQRIFSERFAECIKPWGRKTNRLMAQLTAISLALAGAAGARSWGDFAPISISALVVRLYCVSCAA